MELRSRRRLSGPSVNGDGEHGQSGLCNEEDESNHMGGGDGSDEEFSLPSSDSDDNSFGPDNEQQPAEQSETSQKKKYSKSNKRRRKRSGALLMWEVWEEEHDRWINENLTEDVDFDHQHGLIAEAAEAPSELIMPLLRYQKEWLAWALKQEESSTRGGILADEMGMGKTIQAIALVLAKRELHRNFLEFNGQSPLSGSSSDLTGIKATLVVCPVVAVTQWVSEINRYTTKGSTKVLVYHGANREKSSKLFCDYDFVITTYSIIESEFRKYMMPPKKKCVYCGNSFYEKKLMVHLKYFCGPDANRTAKQSKQTRKKLKTTSAPSKQKTESDKDKSWPMEFSEVELGLRKEKSLLHSLKWERIILDEAHFIKDRRCNTAKAIFALDSSYKWALSGTPLQNRVGELYSLVRFLQIVPYSYYLCKDCDCRTLDYGYGSRFKLVYYLSDLICERGIRSSTQCSSCPHSSVRHFCWWNKYVSNPIQKHGNADHGRRAMILLKHKVLKNIVLRRTKKGRASDLALPPRIVILRRDILDVREEDYYESLYNESQAQFNTYVEAGTLMNNYAHIFDLLTRLRQAVDHPYLVVYSKTSALKGGNMDDAGSAKNACGICHEPAEDPVVTSCAHVFCKTCLLDFSASLGEVSCPVCSKLLTVDFTGNTDAGDQTAKTTIKGFRSGSILNRVQLDDFQTSTKIEALREEIRFMAERDGSAKGIVFSQFTSFLDLIHYSLLKSGISCVQLVGSMSLAARDAAIKRFAEDPDCKIFLMSLKAGGVALNLTVASHEGNAVLDMAMLDSTFDLSEFCPKNCITKVVRCCGIVRFVIENTVEERILQLQEKKELVFEGYDDDPMSGNGSDDQFDIPSVHTGDSSSYSDESGVVEEMEVLGVNGRGKATVGVHGIVETCFESYEMETGLSYGHRPRAQPPRAAEIDFLNWVEKGEIQTLKQEESTTRGGILTDEVGMGKTIQAVALCYGQHFKFIDFHYSCGNEDELGIKSEVGVEGKKNVKFIENKEEGEENKESEGIVKNNDGKEETELRNEDVESKEGK
ncbi:unnamed protein product [Dovyalis caffra]|uniref:DNA repair protein RAD16 n=1 Tax=Dovyalis caffra TaxID=77055 RepID=A0AAV1SCI6_9ROSI|nr:unnamed protein product [Dovyalis caffra]